MAVCFEVESFQMSQQRVTPEGLRVASAFKALRRNAGLTQEEVARRVDLTLSGYRPYEQGKRQLRIDQVANFARAFGVSTELLSARLGLGPSSLREIRVAECEQLMTELDGEPPEVAETLLRWFKESIALHRRGRLAREN